MQSHYDAVFSREMACTVQEWLGWLPAAIGEHDWECSDGQAWVFFAQGHLRLDWQVAPPRVIALMRLPRLIVHFAFEALNEAQRHAFMKRFDLYMQRGGG